MSRSDPAAAPSQSSARGGRSTTTAMAAAAAASSTAQGLRPWPLAAASANLAGTSRPAASAPARTARPLWSWTRRPPRRALTAARTGAAEVGRSSPPDAVTYSSSISTDMPLYEPPGVSFDEYLLDRSRVFRAMFPDESRSQQLSDEEWRVQMLPLQFLLLTVHPVVVMQLRHRGGVLELRITEWELRGLDSGYKPESFDLGVRGSLYADRGGARPCRLKGHLEIAISCVLPPPLRLVPEGVLRSVAESVLSRLAEKMKQDVNVGVVADFKKFRREKAASGATGKASAGADAEQA